MWLDDAGYQQVVHHGSGSGSVLFAVLPSALSALRLFAVGYEEPCWNYDWAEPPKDDSSALDVYREWASERWGFEPPRTGVEALELGEAAPEWLNVNGPDDSFGRWLTESTTAS